MIDLLRYHVLDLGCQSIRGELFLSSGVLDGKSALSIHCRPCGKCCPICTKDWHKTFLTVDRVHVVRFLRHLDRKLNLLWNNKDEKWRLKDIFRTNNIAKYNVDSLFLQLIASGMILLSKLDGKLQWTVGERIIYTHGKDFTLVCDETDSWIGINVF